MSTDRGPTRNDLEARLAEVERERDELAAMVGRLRDAASWYMSRANKQPYERICSRRDLEDVINETLPAYEKEEQ